jgi:hypothetical protein
MLETLKSYQAWRRGEDKRKLNETDLTPTVIGLAIDWAIDEIEQKEELERWVAGLADEHDQVPAWLRASAKGLLAHLAK